MYKIRGLIILPATRRGPLTSISRLELDDAKLVHASDAKLNLLGLVVQPLQDCFHRGPGWLEQRIHWSLLVGRDHP